MPMDRGAVDQQLQSLGDSNRWWDLRELRDLPAVLHADENVLAISRGKIARIRLVRRYWLIVVTDQRIVCIRSARGRGWRQIEIDAEMIDRVALRVGPFKGRVRIWSQGIKYKLLVPRMDAYRIVTALSGLGSPANEALMGFAPARMVRRMMDHVLALPAATFQPQMTGVRAIAPAAAKDPAVEQHVHELEDQVAQLKEQVEFLEQLLRERQASAGR